MTPQQITDALEEIISNIADAHILIYRLQQEFDVARRKNAGGLDVVYEDIYADMRLEDVWRTLRAIEKQLSDREGMYLPEHFERLRAGAE
jgi:transcription initiation factor TFIIIB Brf1 subunit/transcription initiation factor TFIIB